MSDRTQQFADWLAAPKVNRKGISERTVKTYKTVVTDALKKKDPCDILKKKGLANSTRRVYRAVLLKWAEFIDDTDLATQVKQIPIEQRGTKPAKLTTAFTEDEMKQFHQVLDQLKGNKQAPWVWPALRLFVILGLRAGIDLCGLQRDALREALRTGVLQIWTKRERRRTLPIGIVREEVEMLLKLKKWTVLADLIAPDSKDHVREHTAYKHVSDWLKLIGEQAGIDPKEIQSRRFRNTAAQQLYERTKDPHLVQKFLGHASLDTTIRYLGHDRTDEINTALKEIYDGTSEEEKNTED